MSQRQGAGLERGSRVRADVRQALLKFSNANLYPGIPPGEWQPAAVMVAMVLSVGSGSRHQGSADRDRVLDDRHFQFRGLPSAGTQDDQRRSRLEDRQERRSEAE
jgi:hypothetical protein